MVPHVDSWTLSAARPRDFLVIDDGDMMPAYRPGGTVYFTEPEPDLAALDGIDCLVTLADGRQLLRRIIAGAERGRYHLEAYNPEVEPIMNAAIVEARPVAKVVPRRARGA